jgi:hypothetical protein
MKNKILSRFVPFVFAAASTTHAASVGWNYQGVGGVGLQPDDVAGAPGYEQANWNNHPGNGQGPGNTPLLDLLDDSGATTTLDLTGWTLATNNSWEHNQTGNPNEILMNDFNDTQPTLVFSEIPYSVYSVVVYYGNNEGPSTSLLSVGSQSLTITTGNTLQSSFGEVGFVEGTELNPSSPSNYAVFNGLTDSTLQISLSGANNNGISAVQFIGIPEPVTPTLLGLALMLSCFKRRR